MADINKEEILIMFENFKTQQDEITNDIRSQINNMKIQFESYQKQVIYQILLNFKNFKVI